MIFSGDLVVFKCIFKWNNTCYDYNILVTAVYISVLQLRETIFVKKYFLRFGRVGAVFVRLADQYVNGLSRCNTCTL